MSNTDRFILISEAASILNVSADRIMWFIAIGELSSMKNQENKSRKLVSLQDVHRLRTSPLIARWFIYSLVDPRDNTVRYVGQTNEPLIRFNRHLSEKTDYIKYEWIRELKKCGLQPHLEILEALNSSQRDVDEREFYWIQYFLRRGTKLVNQRLERYTNGSPAIRSLLIDQSEWVPMVEAAERLGTRRMLISRLASKGRIETRENPLDERVRLVNFTELRVLFDQYGSKMDEDDNET